MHVLPVLSIILVILGCIGPIPQVLRILKERTSAGLSLVAWQLFLAMNLAWATHAIMQRDVVILLPNIIGIICDLAILILMRRDRALPLWKTYWLGLLICAVGIFVRVEFGIVAYGLFMCVPQSLGCLGQLVDVVRDPDITGVSWSYLAMTSCSQGMWIFFGLLKPDKAVVISASCMFSIVFLTLIWFVLRRTKIVRPIRFARAH